MGCVASPGPDPVELVDRGKGAWSGDWHTIWWIEWQGAPVRGPLVAEFWHAGGDQLRIETLEAPCVSLSSLVLVKNSNRACLYDQGQSRVDCGEPARVRIPLASDTLDVWDWLLTELAAATVDGTGRDMRESGPAWRISYSLGGGDRVTVWYDEATGLPASFNLRSAVWGDLDVEARFVGPLEVDPSALFSYEDFSDAELADPE